MARPIPRGTPGRTSHYVAPRRPYRFVGPALAIGGVMLAVLFPLLSTPESWGLKAVVSPGGVAQAHAALEARCQHCHLSGAGSGLTRRGTANARCLRCHGAATGGTFASAAHVLFGGGDPGSTGARERDLACADCHVEHRGRQQPLSRTPDTHCYECHFSGLGGHPEFEPVRARAREAPGLRFSHAKHFAPDALRQFVSVGMTRNAPAGAEATCVLCHEPDRASRDFRPLAFERVCVGCHEKEFSPGSGIVPKAGGALLPSAIARRGEAVAGLPATESAARAAEATQFEIDEYGDFTRRTAVHRDAWILYNATQLARRLHPEEHAKARAELAAERARLQRRLALAEPLAGLDREGLQRRESSLVAALAEVDARIAAQPTALDGARAIDRLLPLLEQAAANPALRARAAELRSGIEAARNARDRSAGPLRKDEFEQQRRALVGLLQELAEAEPSRAPAAASLIRRLEALDPGETSAELLARVRAQHDAELAAVRDELGLIATGARPSEPPPGALASQTSRRLRDAVASAQARLTALEAGPADPVPDPAAAAEALAAVWNGCKKCHALPTGGLAPVRAARSVLTRARFLHEPHLRASAGGGRARASCLGCHPGIDKSQAAEDLHLAGIDSCRTCHGGSGAGDSCQECHRYHPVEAP